MADPGSSWTMTEAFYGRQAELGLLRTRFDEVTGRACPGPSGGPRFVVLVAENGLGKTRLIQELYSSLASDPLWNPPQAPYWPARPNDDGRPLAVAPRTDAARSNAIPRFLWIGARCLAVGSGSLEDGDSIASALASALRDHAVRRDLGDGAESRSELPTAQHASIGRGNASTPDADRGSVLLRSLRRELDKPDAVPVVLCLDDGHSLDPGMATMLAALWTDAKAASWPLLVVVAHCAHAWGRLNREETTSATAWLQRLAEAGEAEVLCLPRASEQSLRAVLLAHLPGLPDSQADLLIAKASGNFLTMEENICDLLARPEDFEGGDSACALTVEGADRVAKWDSDRSRRIEQRFLELPPDVRQFLGWCSQMGSRFLGEVVSARAASTSARSSERSLLERCTGELHFLAMSGRCFCEFRDDAVRAVVARGLDPALSREGLLSDLLRKSLADWVNNGFDPGAGTKVWSSERFGRRLDRCVNDLEHEERRALLGMAIRALPIMEAADWGTPVNAASLRAVALAIDLDMTDHLWESVARNAMRIERVDVAAVPERVVASDIWEGVAEACDDVGLFRIGARILAALLQRECVADEGPGVRQSRLCNNLGRCLEMDGDTPGAITRYRESIDHLRAALTSEYRAEAEWPRHQRFRLACRLEAVANLLADRGDTTEARLLLAESVGIMRRLLDEDPNPSHIDEFCRGLSHTADLLLADGDRAGALEALEEAERAVRLGVQDWGDVLDLRRRLGVVAGEIGSLLEDLGVDASAEARLLESVAVFRKVVAEDDRLQHVDDLRVAAWNLARYLSRRGDRVGALSAYEEAASAARAAGERCFESRSMSDHRRQLARALMRMARLHDEGSESAKALACFDEACRVADETLKVEGAKWALELRIRSAALSTYVLPEAARVVEGHARLEAAGRHLESLSLMEMSTPEGLRNCAKYCELLSGAYSELRDDGRAEDFERRALSLQARARAFMG
jgi:tetratricopeptide (TPR) repeat protein